MSGVFRPAWSPVYLRRPVLAGTHNPTPILTVGAGSFSVSGQDVGLLNHQTLTADGSTFVFTGEGAGVYMGQKVAADLGSFTLTGQSAGLTEEGSLAADRGSFALTGQTALTAYGRVVSANKGRFFTAGFDVDFIIDRPFTEPGGIVIGLGSKAWGYCAVCGFRYPKKKLFKPVVNGRTQVMLRCRSCTDVDNPQGFPQRFIRGRKE